MTPATDRQSDERWELHDVQALSTEKFGTSLPSTVSTRPKRRSVTDAAEVDSAMALADQWEDDHDVDASGYDQDFIWMAAEVFWSRWASDLPYRERIYDLVQEGRELREQGQRRRGLPAMADCLGDHYRRHAGRHHDNRGG